MKTFNLLLPLFFFLSSCSYFIQSIDSTLVNKEDFIAEIPTPDTYCSLEMSPGLQLIGLSKREQEKYIELSQDNVKWDLIDHIILWGLTQMSAMPHLTTPGSRFQLVFRYDNQTQYLDFSSEAEENQFPFLHALHWLREEYKKKLSLEDYASIIQKKSLTKSKVNKDFSDFLISKKEDIRKNEELKNHYFRGDEVLSLNESLPEIDLQKLIKIYRKNFKTQQIVIKSSLYPFVTEKGKKGECNYDFNLYNNSIFLIDKKIPLANIFGLALRNEVFLASTSQELDGTQSFEGTPIFKGSSKVRSTALCLIENEDNLIWSMSNKSRDPGQHLFHLVRYGLPEGKTIQEIDQLMKQSRYIFLSDPIRLIIESQRGTVSQSERLLKLNLPIYHADKLGNIWSFAEVGNQKRFIIDDRNSGEFSCK
jgi:hypothetical protein